MSIMFSPKAVDLFCGCGGLTEGLKKAGFEVIGAVEIDTNAVETYRSNHPEVLVWQDDIRSIDTGDFMNKLSLSPGELSLLAGCPPCQGFSSLRTKNGNKYISDPRNFLIREYLRFVEALLPRAIMMENVPGIGKESVCLEFTETLHRLGYVGMPRILNAEDYGVPQRRKRFIFMAGRGFPIFYAQSSSIKRTVRDAIGHLRKAGTSGDPMHDRLSHHSNRILDIIRKIPHDGGSRCDLPEKMKLDCHKKCDGFKDVYGRMAWDKVAPTITSGCCNPSKGRFLHPIEDRPITMREAAILQGFPENYYFPVGNKTEVTLMIGNALPPPFIEAHALEVRKALMCEKESAGNERKKSF